MIYNRTKKGIKIAEIWYNNTEIETALQSGTDIIRCHYMDSLPPGASAVENLYTLLIDLSRTEEEITSGFDKTTKYQANRGKTKDNVTAETFFSCGEKDMARFDIYIRFFNDFAKTKNRGTVSFSDYEQFLTAGNICVRCIKDNETGEPLVMHCYVVSDGKARLHQSASLFRNNEDKEARNRVGRVNKFLHLDDMLYFKEQGIPYYDFGGWYGGNTDTEKLSINKFKEAFGGEKHPEYSCIIPVSFKGKLSTFVRNILKKKG